MSEPKAIEGAHAGSEPCGRSGPLTPAVYSPGQNPAALVVSSSLLPAKVMASACPRLDRVEWTGCEAANAPAPALKWPARWR